ncbi:hypothetical protein HLH26_19205 [Gluconacetobacter sp. 1b LMG 1731]|uniref:Uncharacterized protein n=1 Tax=Gluconacetobacter dulcium TaxID=2729096 RepID=A0A7W4IPI2_9PROT|nr:hypothetical protein [Gluconacetobacter dulcium]
MANVLLRSDPGKLVLLEWRGQPVIQSNDFLSNLLDGVPRTKLGFAEPLVRWPRDNEAGEITWYADDGLELRRLSSFPDEERDRLVRDLGIEITRVREAAARAGRAQALLLDRALVIPDREAVFTDGRVFLFAPWGMLSGRGRTLKSESEGVDFANSVLGRLTAARGEPAAPPAGNQGDEKPDPLEAPSPRTEIHQHTPGAACAGDGAAPAPAWTVPIAPVSYGARRPLSRPVAAVLHGLTFVCFFSLAMWTAFSIAAHTRILTLEGHPFGDLPQ